MKGVPIHSTSTSQWIPAKLNEAMSTTASGIIWSTLWDLELTYLSTGCQEAQISSWLKTYAAASALEEAGQYKLLNKTIYAAGYQAVSPNYSIGATFFQLCITWSMSHQAGACQRHAQHKCCRQHALMQTMLCSLQIHCTMAFLVRRKLRLAVSQCK